MYYMSSFFPRTVTTRNSLPSAIADAHVLVSFKHGLSNLTTLVLLTFLSFSFHSKPSTITRCIEVECDCANVSCRSREVNLRRRKNLSTATILTTTLNRFISGSCFPPNCYFLFLTVLIFPVLFQF